MGTHVGMGLRCYGYWQLVTFCSIEFCLQQLPVYLCLFTVVPSSALSRLCQSAFNKKTGDRDENLLIGRCYVPCLISIYLQPDDRPAVASGTEEEVDLLPKSESNKSHRPSMVEINHSGYSNQEIVYWLQLLYFSNQPPTTIVGMDIFHLHLSKTPVPLGPRKSQPKPILGLASFGIPWG